jgi:hypothetical protein
MMKSLLTTIAVPAMAAPSYAKDAPRSLSQNCRVEVSAEQYEQEGRSLVGQLNVQRFSDCLSRGQ